MGMEFRKPGQGDSVVGPVVGHAELLRPEAPRTLPAMLSPVTAVSFGTARNLIRRVDPTNPVEWEESRPAEVFLEYGTPRDYVITRDTDTLHIRIFEKVGDPRYEAVLNGARFLEDDAKTLALAADRRKGEVHVLEPGTRLLP